MILNNPQKCYHQCSSSCSSSWPHPIWPKPWDLMLYVPELHASVMQSSNGVSSVWWGATVYQRLAAMEVPGGKTLVTQVATSHMLLAGILFCVILLKLFADICAQGKSLQSSWNSGLDSSGWHSRQASVDQALTRGISAVKRMGGCTARLISYRMRPYMIILCVCVHNCD